MYAARCDKRRMELGVIAEEAEKARIVQEGKHRVVHWGGGLPACHLCEDYTTDDPIRLQQHFAHRHHDPSISVLSKYNMHIHEQYSEDLDGATCRHCKHKFSSKEKARQHIDKKACSKHPTAMEGPASSVAQKRAAKEQADEMQEGKRCKGRGTEYATIYAARKHAKESRCGKKMQAEREAAARQEILKMEEARGQEPEESEWEEEAERADVGEQEDVEEISVYGTKVEEVAKFKYLGRILRVDRIDEEEVKVRIRAARKTMAALQLPLYRRSTVSARTKLAVWRTVVVAQLLYGAETWTLRVEATAILRDAVPQRSNWVERKENGGRDKIPGEQESSGREWQEENTCRYGK